MSKRVGGLDYGPDEALREGIPHNALGEPEVEFWAVDVQQSTYTEEADFVANRIRELLDGTHYVRQGDTLRPIVAEDIAILLRSPGSVGKYYMDSLERLGIRCTSGGGQDLLQTREIATLRSLLHTISNPRQDIPLIATLASPVFGFTADDLARLRSVDRRCSIYDALLAWDEPKAKEFLRILDILRREARLQNLAQLIEKIFLLTRMDSIFGAMPGGDLRKDNLRAFYGLAADFESSARRDLEHFLDHLDVMQEKGLIAASEQSAPGAVTLMSIHKSKGLEFPVVFVCALSREFNRESSRAQVLCDQDLGLGLSVVDAHNRLRYPTVAKRAIAAKTMSDSLSEEMRVLYVALTRARDRLIMTYASQSLAEDLAQIALRMDLAQTELLTRDVICPGQWVLMTALKRTEAGELFRLGGRPQETRLGDPVWKIGVVSQITDAEALEAEQQDISVDHSLAVDKIRRGISFRYPHMAATVAPSKQTATQRKGRLKDEEAAENTLPKANALRKWRQPSFVSRQMLATDRGNATHAAMQHIDYGACVDEHAVRQEIGRLVDSGRMTKEQAEMVNCLALLRVLFLPESCMGRTSPYILTFPHSLANQQMVETLPHYD